MCVLVGYHSLCVRTLVLCDMLKENGWYKYSTRVLFCLLQAAAYRRGERERCLAHLHIRVREYSSLKMAKDFKILLYLKFSEKMSRQTNESHTHTWGG